MRYVHIFRVASKKKSHTVPHDAKKLCRSNPALYGLVFLVDRIELGFFFSNKGLNVISQTLLSEKTDGEPSHFIKKKENIDLSSKPHTTDIMHAHYLL